MAITLNQHKEHVTKKIIGRFNDYTAPKLGLSTFFKSETTTSKEVSIEVERNRNLIAVDVERGTAGKHNNFDRHTEKIYTPPFFKEKFNFSELDVYNRTFGEGLSPNATDYVRMIRTADQKLRILQAKIDRAKELQRAQALQTGIVQMKNGDNIDFKRKASSIVDLGAGNYWDGVTGQTILNDISEGVKFVRQEGKSVSRMYDFVMGAEVLGTITGNEDIQKMLDNRNLNIGAIGTTQFNDVTGFNYHGRLSLKNGTIDLWTYDDTYELDNGTHKQYIDENKAVLLPRDFVGKHAHAGVPAIIRDKANAEFPQWIKQIAAEYYINNYVDPKITAHMFDISSAPLAIPFSVDRIWTVQALANS